MPFETGETESAPFHAPPTGNEIRDELWLLGQPPLRDYLDFVRESVEGGAQMDPRALCDEWRVANDHYYELEKREAGIADKAECLELPPAMRPLAQELAARPHFRITCDCLPVSFGMVELDRLILYQPHVTLPFVEELRARLAPAPDAQALFRFCQPLERRDPPVRVRRLGDRRYQFVSESTDFRFHKAALLRPEQVIGHDSFGPVGAVVGLMVGFGSNFLSVIRSDNRLLLHNGYHRAYALRAAGFTHVPAVIQTVTRRDELALVASQPVVDEPAFYFAAKRPPLLKDFFDPKISKVLPVRRMEKVIEVSFEYEEYDVPRT
jgi:hypothetical protein